MPTDVVLNPTGFAPVVGNPTLTMSFHFICHFGLDPESSGWCGVENFALLILYC